VALTRGGVSLLSTEGLGTMEEQVTTNYKEFSRQGGVNITAPLPRGRRHHHRLGRRSPHPLPSSKPAGSREEVNNLAGGAWRGLEECWGIWENFRVTLESKSGGFTF